MIVLLLFFSVLLQIAVAVIALRAPRSPRTRAAWRVFAIALGAIALRRIVALGGVLYEPQTAPSRPYEELIAIGNSLLLLVGVWRMRNLWEDADAALAETKAREAAHRESEELWQRVFEYAPDGYIMLELDGHLARLNRAAAEIAGVTRESSEGRHIFELGILDDEGMAQAVRNLGLMQQGEDPGPAEYTFHRGDGTTREVEIIGYLIEIRGRKLMLTIVHDVTRRKRAEAELKSSRARLEEAQRVAGIVTFELDLREGTMLLSSQLPVGIRLPDGRTKMTMEEGFTYIHPEDRDRVVQELAAGTAREGSGDVVVEYRQHDLLRDRDAVVRTTARAEFNENGDVVRLIGATLDLTDIRAAEQEIRTLNADLEARVRERTAELERAVDELEAFSYSVSHDLRSPLRAMAGYSDMVLEEEGDDLCEQSREHLHRIRASSVRMAGLIDGLLSLSRLTRATRNDQLVNLSELARGIVSELRRGDPEREVDVVVEEGIEVVADREMMSLVLQNLLSNAWKFTRAAAKPRIAFGRGRDGAYFVKDNGVGFDASQSARLFRPFERLHRTDEFEGTGIGLATVGRIVRHHGGRVWAEASIGKGSTFWFTIGTSRPS